MGHYLPSFATAFTLMCGFWLVESPSLGKVSSPTKESSTYLNYSQTQPRTVMAPLLAPVDIGVSLEQLPDSERRALISILAAARVMDGIFLEQVWAGNPSLLIELAKDDSAQGKARLNFFLANKGPWSRVENNRSFIPGTPTKPKGANYYPSDATRQEISEWLNGLEGETHKAATGYFTTIRRRPDGSLTAIPYSLEYQTALSIAATHLKEAAALTADPTLSHYLDLRAKAFVSNDYYESDIAWMELDSIIEPTIGPYEVYEDEWFNYKAAYEAFVAIRDNAETDRLKQYTDYLQELENNLPINPESRNPDLGDLSPIRVVNVIFTAGDANSGIQTAAFNLPNDERVVQNYGSKRVMLKNVQEAKFETVLSPIAEISLTDSELQDVSFEAFFTHILMHELMHGLGPHDIVVNGKTSTVRQELRDTHSAIEEAKADVAGLWAIQHLVNIGLIKTELQRQVYTTFLASIFRSIRFGISEAHGLGVAIQLNTFLDQGAVKLQRDGKFSVDHNRIPEVVEGLTQRVMTIQADGDYEAARQLIDTLGIIRPEVAVVIDRAQTIPIDIEPNYWTASALNNP